MAAYLKLARSRRLGVAYLRQSQPADGGFRGLASAQADNFSRARTHPTIFFTALILSCLHEVAGSAVVRRRAARWLLQHKSQQWSWNYWVRGSEAVGLRAYPDDLDDTAGALAGLWRYDRSLIDGAVLAHLAGQLIATEVAPGGPYTTWLVDREAPAVWRDVDIAVNANIGFLLRLQKVQLPGLERYVTAAIQDQTLTSPYYVGTIPVLYFVARWYRGERRAMLRDMVVAQLEEVAAQGSPLHWALLVTAALNLDVELATVAPAVERLVASQATNGSWPAAALYLEPPVDGAAQYAGSPALTTAFCLEALTAYQHATRRQTIPDKTPTVTIDYVRGCADDIRQPDLRRLYHARVERLAAGDRDQQITGLATIMALVCRAAVDGDTLLHLNAGSVQGWLAYTIYDDFLDLEGDPQLLGVANLALRQVVASFRAALPDQPAFQRLVDATLAKVDGANTWEVVYARAAVQRGVVRIERLPDYGEYAQLAERSWGHMLAACGVLVAAGYRLDGTEVRQLQRFFHHFLIARQLNDDAHDWEDDLAQGRLTAVVDLLLTGYSGDPRHINLKTERAQLRQWFWERTIAEVSLLIQRHSGEARTALAHCRALHDYGQLESWLGVLEGSVEQALEGRRQAQQFLSTYADNQDDARRG